jgi:raffinose/stachyose/melibiose transport system substrate-binding protein
VLRDLRRSRLGRPLILLCASAATIAAAAALASPRGANGANKTTTIRVVTDTGWSFVLEAAKQFEKQHPNVKVVYAPVANSQSIPYFSNLPRNLAAPTAPDIDTVRVEPGPYYGVLRQNLLAPIDDVWKTDGLEKAYPPTVRALYTAPDGHHYALGVDQWWPVVWYSKTAFQKAGITPPANGRITSQAQLLQWGATLKKAGYPVPLASGTTDEEGPAYIFGQLLQSACGDAALANLAANWRPNVARTTKWTSPCVLKALQATEAYAKGGVLGPAPATESDEQATSYFTQGKAAMYISGSWQPSSFASLHLTTPYGWLLLPPVPGGSPTEVLSANYDALAVVRSSKNQALAKQFLALVGSKEFLYGPGFGKTFGLAPDRTDGVLKPSIFFPAIVSIQKAIPQLGGPIPLPYTQVPWGLTVTPAIASMWAGSKSPEQVANAFEQAALAARANPASVG